MSKNPETVFKEKFVKILKKIPKLWIVKIEAGAVHGTPDLIICHEGRFIAYELKTETGRTSELQKYNLQKIEEACGIARVVTPANYKFVLESDFNLQA